MKSIALKSAACLLLILFATALLFLGNTNHLLGQTLPAGFQAVSVSTGWNLPLGIRFAPNGNKYVWEKEGKVWVVDSAGIKQSQPLLDISEEVGNWSDHGLNGFVLDPNFHINGFYYVFYTVDRHHLLHYGTPNYNPSTNQYNAATIARVVRYQADASNNFFTTVAGSRTILIGENKKTGIPVLHKSHSGGHLQFGRDGSLLISTGDGASYSGVDTGGTVYSYWSQAVADSIIQPDQNVGAFRSQLLNSLNGKILRIDPTSGNGLPSNPFYNPAAPRSAESRIYATGLRNPYRFIVKPGTGSTDITAGDPGILIIGDVGHNTWEEIDLCSQPGQNFGWPLYEGLTPYTNYVLASPYNKYAPNPLYAAGLCNEPFFRFRDLLIQEVESNPYWPNPCDSFTAIPASVPHFMHTRPILEAKHSGGQVRTGIFVNGQASEIMINNPLSPVTGPLFNSEASIAGAWYSGTSYPVQYQNVYFHCDYSKMWLRVFKFNSANQLTQVMNFATNIGYIAHVEYNPYDQSLYYINIPFDIYKIVYNGTVNQLPVARATADTTYGYGPLTVSFDGSQSFDPDSLPLSYHWNFGDGNTSNLPNPVHTFTWPTNDPVTFTVTLTITDNIGQTDSVKIKIYLNNTPPVVNITSFADSMFISAGIPTSLPLAANIYDNEHDSTQLFYNWQAFLQHNSHFHVELTDTSKTSYYLIPPSGCSVADTIWYRIRLTVRDAHGLEGYDEKLVFPYCLMPQSNFDIVNQVVCTDDTIQFVDLSEGMIDHYEWIFDGGTPAVSNVRNPKVVYSTPGKYTVTLITQNGAGSDTLTMVNWIDAKFKPFVYTYPSGSVTVCSGDSVQLVAYSNQENRAFHFSWLFNGASLLVPDNTEFSAQLEGLYQSVLTTDWGCSRTSVGVNVFHSDIQSTIVAMGDTVFCLGDSVLLAVPFQPGNVYQWQHNENNILLANDTFYYARQSGFYRVFITNLSGCSVFSNSINVSVPCRTVLDGQLSLVSDNQYLTLMFGDSGFQNDSATEIRIYDYSGRMVADRRLAPGNNSQHRIDISALSSGIYTVLVLNGHRVFTEKITVFSY